MLYNPAMKLHVICIFFSLFAGVIAATAQTAQTAISVIEKEKGAAFVENLIEIKGARGEPQPPSWTFRFNEPAARGGLREIVVQGGQILSERTPVRGFGGTGDLPTLPVKLINLDTRAVFNLANQAAIRQGLGFHWLDYALRPDVQTSQPVWYLTFIDVFGARVGDMSVDAKSLRILQPLTLDPGATAGRENASHPSGAQHTGEEPATGGAIGQTFDFIWRTRRSVHNAIFGGIGAAQEWLTGTRTIGTEEPE
jgi:hypothetical protein